MKLSREANDRFLVGDHITDEELVKLYLYYDHLGSVATYLDNTMTLFVREIFKRCERLKGYGIGRGLIDPDGNLKRDPTSGLLKKN